MTLHIHKLPSKSPSIYCNIQVNILNSRSISISITPYKYLKHPTNHNHSASTSIMSPLAHSINPRIYPRTLSPDTKINLIIGILAITIGILSAILAWPTWRLTRDRRRSIEHRQRRPSGENISLSPSPCLLSFSSVSLPYSSLSLPFLLPLLPLFFLTPSLLHFPSNSFPSCLIPISLHQKLQT